MESDTQVPALPHHNRLTIDRSKDFDFSPNFPDPGRPDKNGGNGIRMAIKLNLEGRGKGMYLPAPAIPGNLHVDESQGPDPVV